VLRRAEGQPSVDLRDRCGVEGGGEQERFEQVLPCPVEVGIGFGSGFEGFIEDAQVAGPAPKDSAVGERFKRQLAYRPEAIRGSIIRSIAPLLAMRFATCFGVCEHRDKLRASLSGVVCTACQKDLVRLQLAK
jgi:hypothetical protein